MENRFFELASTTQGTRLRKAGAYEEPGTRGQALLACSACAGDYEDPERTAEGPREELREEGEGWLTADEAACGTAEGDEFPAGEVITGKEGGEGDAEDEAR